MTGAAQSERRGDTALWRLDDTRENNALDSAIRPRSKRRS